MSLYCLTAQRLSFHTALVFVRFMPFSVSNNNRAVHGEESFHHSVFCGRVVDISLRSDRSQLSLPFRIEDLYAGINYFVFCFQHHQSAAVAVALSSRREDVPLARLTVHRRPCEYCTRDDDHNY